MLSGVRGRVCSIPCSVLVSWWVSMSDSDVWLPAPPPPSLSCQLCELCEAGEATELLEGRGRGVNSSQWARKQVCLARGGGVEYLNPGVTIQNFNGKNVDHRTGELVINSTPHHHINVFLDTTKYLLVIIYPLDISRFI